MKVFAEAANHVTILSDVTDFQKGFIKDKASRRLGYIVWSTDLHVWLENHELVDPMPLGKFYFFISSSSQIDWY